MPVTERIISPQGVVDDPIEGIQDGMSEREYRKRPGLNHSSLKHFGKNAAEFQFQLTNKINPTPAMVFGLYSEWLIMNHEKLPENSGFVLQPDDYVGQANKWKEWKKAQIDAGLTVVPKDIRERAESLLAAIKEKPVWELISKAKTQVPVFAILRQGGLAIQVKILIDMLPDGYVGLWDFKTATDCSAEYWAKHVLDLHYHTQAAWYIKVCKLLGLKDKDRFIHVVMESQPYHHVQIHELSNPFIRLGNYHIEKWVGDFIRCTQSGEWNGYQEGINLLRPPKWAERELREL